MPVKYRDIKKYITPTDGKRFSISLIKLTKKQVELEKIRGLYSGNYQEVHTLEPGTYIRLVDKKRREIVMSNTPMELETNRNFIEEARGDVLIAGLGLGLIVIAIQSKTDVKSILVCEKEEEIINLTNSIPFNKKVKIIQEDIFDHTPEKKFDTIYFDIWNNICGDNYEEMKELHKKFRKFLNKEGFMNSWRFVDCRRLK